MVRVHGGRSESKQTCREKTTHGADEAAATKCCVHHLRKEGERRETAD